MDRHLNIFTFFNANDEDYLEDNLSRAFALCLKYDSVFLDKILQFVLSEETYSALFNTDFPDYKIEIDLQNRVSELEGFGRIIAVACSGKEIGDFDNVVARETDSPETDVSIIINDTCILFEFKRTGEDCAAQLKCQAEKIKRNCFPETTLLFKDLAWHKIVKILLNVSSLQKQIHAENPFTNDFIRFLERRFPQWFPVRPLRNISFPKDETDPNYFYLNERLNQIKIQIYGEESAEEKIGRFRRLAVKVNFGWINEVNIEPLQKGNENFIAIRLHIGDTKKQGNYFFTKKPLGVEWLHTVAGFRLEDEPYIKLSDMYASALLHLRPTLEDSKKTHNLDFFKRFAGQWKRANWEFFETELNQFIPDWKNKCCIPNTTDKGDWNDAFENSNRSGFLLSVGVMLTVYLPYEQCQKLDNSETDSELSVKIREIISHIKKTIDE
jgi:hypothetical protein